MNLYAFKNYHNACKVFNTGLLEHWSAVKKLLLSLMLYLNHTNINRISLLLQVFYSTMPEYSQRNCNFMCCGSFETLFFPIIYSGLVISWACQLTVCLLCRQPIRQATLDQPEQHFHQCGITLFQILLHFLPIQLLFLQVII